MDSISAKPRPVEAWVPYFRGDGRSGEPSRTAMRTRPSFNVTDAEMGGSA